MRILALEPYYGGSHRAFLDGWIENSRHDWTLITHPAHGWKWRMRHSGMSCAEQVRSLLDRGERWDLVFCTDMLPLAEFAGLVPAQVGTLPKVLYFHENQLTYPQNHADQRDLHFGLTNMSAALAADGVWFNSAFHKSEFLRALENLLKKMRPPRMLEAVGRIREKSTIQPPGIEIVPSTTRQDGPVRILWSARWEFDKNPNLFFEALEILDGRGVDFRISVIGQQFIQGPDIFEQARERWSDRIERWGYQQSRTDYIAALQESDIAVSTADHEFFGIGMAEAASAGAFPLMPERLAYPEVFAIDEPVKVFYGGTAGQLADRLEELSSRIGSEGGLSWCSPQQFRQWTEKYSWPNRAAQMDGAIEAIIPGAPGPDRSLQHPGSS